MAAASTWWVVGDGPETGYAGAEVRGLTLHLTRCYVAPDARGLRLQRRLTAARQAWGRRHGAIKASTYTWGGNLASIRSLIHCGYLPTRREWDGERSWIWWERAL